MSIERNILNISALGLLLHRFYNKLPSLLLYTSKRPRSSLDTSQHTLSTTVLKRFVLGNWKELPLLSTVSNVCQFLLKNRITYPYVGMRKLNDPPLTKRSKADGPVPSLLRLSGSLGLPLTKHLCVPWLHWNQHCHWSRGFCDDQTAGSRRTS